MRINRQEPDMLPMPRATKNVIKRSYRDFFNSGTNKIPIGAAIEVPVKIKKPNNQTKNWFYSFLVKNSKKLIFIIFFKKLFSIFDNFFQKIDLRVHFIVKILTLALPINCKVLHRSKTFRSQRESNQRPTRRNVNTLITRP
jgi:hypothetical protein